MRLKWLGCLGDYDLWVSLLMLVSFLLSLLVCFWLMIEISLVCMRKWFLFFVLKCCIEGVVRFVLVVVVWIFLVVMFLLKCRMMLVLFLKLMLKFGLMVNKFRRFLRMRSVDNVKKVFCFFMKF